MQPRAAVQLEAQSPLLVILIASLGIPAYLSFLCPASRGDGLPHTLVIIAEITLPLWALLSMWTTCQQLTILSATQDPRDFAFHDERANLSRERRILQDGLTNTPSW